MIQKYLKTRLYLQAKQEEFDNLVSQQKTANSHFEILTGEKNKALQKGDGFATLEYQKYEEVFKKEQEKFLEKSKPVLTEIQKSRATLDKLLKKDSSLSKYEFYSKIVPFQEFYDNATTMLDAREMNLITEEELKKAKEDALKYKQEIIAGDKYMMKDNRTIYADMIIFNQNNEILFVKRNGETEFEPNKYAFPGGHVEPAEDAMFAAIREVKEEINLDVNKTVCFEVGTFEDTICVIHYFATKINTDYTAITLAQSELVNYEWVPMGEVGDKNLLMNIRDNLETLVDIPTFLLDAVVDDKGRLIVGDHIQG